MSVPTRPSSLVASADPEKAPVVVELTATMGRGVFASRAIAAGEKLAQFHSIRVPVGEVKAIRTSSGVSAPELGARAAGLANYWFEDDADGSALIVLGWLELVNHARVPNLARSWQVTPEGDVVTVIADREIAAGEQLTIDYRFDFADPSTPAWA